MTIQETLAEFGRAYGFGHVAMDASCMTRFEFEHGLIVDLEYRAGKGLYLYAAVARFEAKPSTVLLRVLLEANNPVQNPDEFVFSVEPGDSTVMLSHRMDESRLDPEALARALDRFLDLLESWRTRIQTAPPDPEHEAGGSHGRGAWHVRA